MVVGISTGALAQAGASKWAANAHDKGCKLKGQIAPQVGMHSAGRCTKSREYLGRAAAGNSPAV